MGFSFNLAELTERIAAILSRVMSIGISMPWLWGIDVPLWLVLVVAAVVFFIATNLWHERD